MIKILYILIFVLLCDKWEDKTFWIEEQQEFPEFNLLQTSYVKFWFVYVVIRGFNFEHVQRYIALLRVVFCPELCSINLNRFLDAA